jgi:hypothetical protein
MIDLVGQSGRSAFGSALPGAVQNLSPDTDKPRCGCAPVRPVVGLVVEASYNSHPRKDRRNENVTHIFKIGEFVRLEKTWDRSVETTFEVVRLLPVAEDGGVQYHVKSANEKHARSVRQDQLQRNDTLRG